MTIRALKCPNCSAPVPPTTESVIVCRYCDHTLADVPVLPWGSKLGRAPWPGRPEDRGRQRVRVEGHTWVVLGRLARGDGSDVFLARRDARLTEHVVLKMLRAPEDADLLRREQRALKRLEASEAQGAPFFRTLLPQRVRHGAATLVSPRRGAGPLTSVFRWRSGFTHTLEDARAAYPAGVDPRAAVWMWKRLLELLGWVHRSGWVHGAVLPDHALLHARDHGVVLVGWSAATWAEGAPEALPCFSRAREAFYPKALRDGVACAPAHDLVMSARVIAHVLGGGPEAVPAKVPAPVGALVRRCAAGDLPTEDAWALKDAVAAAAKQVWGPPRYVKFTLR